MQRYQRTLIGGMTTLVLIAAVVAIGAGAAVAEPQSNEPPPPVECGGEWLWIHDQLPEGVESGTLTVLFSDGAVRLVRGEFNDSVLYYRLFISEPATLVSAADDVEGGDLRLSDWPFCDDVETTAPSETTVPTETTTPETSGPPPVETSITSTSVAISPGSISVVKQTRPAGDDAEFQVVVYAVDDPDRSWTAMIGDGDTFQIDDLPPGTYAVEELLPSATESSVWVQVEASCDDGSALGTVELEPGESVVCTFVNSLTQVFAETVTTSTATVLATTDTTSSPGVEQLPFTGLPAPILLYLASFITGLGSMVVWTLRPRGRHEGR